MSKNTPLLHGITRRMEILGNKFGENTLFVSQFKENDEQHATVITLVDKEEDGDGFLALRRLLKALVYRINVSTDYELSFNLKRKAKK